MYGTQLLVALAQHIRTNIGKKETTNKNTKHTKTIKSNKTNKQMVTKAFTLHHDIKSAFIQKKKCRRGPETQFCDHYQARPSILRSLVFFKMIHTC